MMNSVILKAAILLLFSLAGFEAYPQGVITRPEHKTQTQPAPKVDKGSERQKPSSTSKTKKQTEPAPKKVVETFTDNGVIFTIDGVTFEMVKVDGGSYSMGSEDGTSWEKPVHTESVGTFYIGKTEVTQALWRAVMGKNPSEFRGETLPVENVSWNDCQKFVKELNRLTGRTFRLPTEAEWEYAARGGNKTRGYTYSGSNDVDRVAWYYGNSGEKTHPVAQKLANELGIYDMSGNVWEWCSDNWCDNYSSPRNSSFRVYRGGSWASPASNCRVAYRYCTAPGDRYSRLGLRLAL